MYDLFQIVNHEKLGMFSTYFLSNHEVKICICFRFKISDICVSIHLRGIISVVLLTNIQTIVSYIPLKIIIKKP